MPIDLTVKQALAKAIQLHKSGELNEAEQIYRAILKLEPKNSDANHNLGLIALSVGQLEAALPFFEQATRENITFPQYWISYIETLLKLNNLKLARVCLDEIARIGLDPTVLAAVRSKVVAAENTARYQTLFSEMINFFNSGDLTNALKICQMLLVQAPAGAHCLSIIGAINSKKGKINEAYAQFKSAVVVDPMYSEAYNNLAIVSQDKGLKREALNSRIRSLTLKPDYSDPYLKVIDSFLTTNQFVRANQLVKAAKILQPDDIELDTRMAIIFEFSHDYKSAMKFCEKVLKAKPLFAELYNTKGNISTKIQELEQAKRFYRKGIILKPELRDIYFGLGRLQRQCTNYGAAVKNVSRSLIVDPTFPLVLNDLGLLHLDFYDLENAIAYFKKALVVEPGYLVSFNNLMLAGSYNDLEGEMLVKRRKQSLFLASTNNNKSKAAPIVCLLPFGRAGSIFLQSLFDGHPSVTTLPGVYFQGWFGEEAWDFFKPSYNDPFWRKALTKKIITHYEPLFDANSRKNVFGTPFGQSPWLARASGFTNMGPEGRDLLKVDKGEFASRMLQLLEGYNSVNKRQVFELIHLAFSGLATSRKKYKDNQKPQILYHIHNPDADQLSNFGASYPNSKYLFIVRHPIQGLESWMLTGWKNFEESCVELEKRNVSSVRVREVLDFNQGYRKVVEPIHLMFNLLMLPNIDSTLCKGVKLEDIKRTPRQILPKLANWLNISDDEMLYKATFSGLEYWGPPSVNSGPVRGFDAKPLDLPIGRVLGQKDIKIFETLFWPFSKEYKYTAKTYEIFEKDLKEIAPWLDEPFEFETRLFGKFFDDSNPINDNPIFQSTHKLVNLMWSNLKSGKNYTNVFPSLIV